MSENDNIFGKCLAVGSAVALPVGMLSDSVTHHGPYLSYFFWRVVLAGGAYLLLMKDGDER